MASILFCIIFGIYFFTLISHTAISWIQNWVWIFHFAGFFQCFFMFITFGGFFGRERERKKIQSDQFILIKIERSVCCLMWELAFTTSLKQFVLTKTMCWLAFERKTKNIMLCVLPLCFQLVIFEKLLYNTNKIINTGTIFVLSSFMQ